MQEYSLFAPIRDMQNVPEDLSEEIQNLLASRAEFLLRGGSSPDAVSEHVLAECTSQSGEVCVSKGKIAAAVAAAMNSIKSRIDAKYSDRVVLSQNGCAWRTIETDPEKHLVDLKTEISSWGSLQPYGFGVPELDQAFGGFYPGEVAVIVGSPGSSKTSLALSLAEDFLARNSKDKILFASLDMPARVVQARRLMRIMDCFQSELYGLVKSSDPAVSTAVQQLKKQDRGRFLLIDKLRSGQYYSFENLKSIIAQTAPAVLVVDYLQLIGANEYKSEFEQVRDIMPKITALAADFGMTIVLLSQMSRSSKTAQKTSLGAHAAGGHSIEDACDIELELVRQETDDGENAVVVSIAKTRRGRAGQSFRLDFKPRSLSFGHTCRIVDKAKAPQKIFDL